jgi:CBS domain containing-hemolysin-like protein
VDIATGQVLPWVAIGLLLLVSALVSGSEVAFFSLSPSDLRDLEQQEGSENASASRILKLLKKPDAERAPRHLLATILVLNNLVNIVIILISTVAMEAAFPSEGLPVWLQWTLHVALVTFLIVLFGEVIPKVYATTNGVQFASFMAGPLAGAQQILRPVWQPLVKVGGWVDRRVATPTSALSVEDLEQALELTAF